MPRQTKPETFEQLFSRLEERVARLEAGGLALEEAIVLYEEGMALARSCQERLDEAELKITTLKESFASPVRGNGTSSGAPGETGFAPAQADDEDEDPFA